MLLSRRGLFALGSAGLLLPRRLLAAENERKFLFVFCPGGWDPAFVFAPIFNDTTDHFAGDTTGTAGGFTFTDSASRPSVRSFFETWGRSTCMINGLQIPSVAHDVCTRLTMTGDSRGATDDWVSIIAGNATTLRLLPNLHVSGPIFPHVYVSASVRLGLAGQLPRLVDGTALMRSDVTYTARSAEVEAMEEAFVRSRVDAWRATARPGFPARIGADEQLALSRASQLDDLAADLMVDNARDLYAAATVAVRALAAGLSRTGMVAYGAGGNGLWDTHSGNDLQDGYFEEVFGVLGHILADLAASPGETTATLLEETTVVVLSEMGRTPEKNAAGGKDHWTWTSAMLIGAGVAGGRTIGAWTEGLLGSTVDLASGEASASGVTLLPGHLGATLLALADIDPGEFVDPTAGDVIAGALA